MSLQWRKLDKKLSTAELPNRIDLYIEEIDRPATVERFYEISVIDHNC